MIKAFFTDGEALVINNMNKEAQNTQLGSAVKTALMGNIGWKDDERYYVDGIIGVDSQANDRGKSLDMPFKTIQYALNVARRIPGTTTLDTTRNRRKYIFVMPGQYNEQLLFSGYNISLIGLGLGNISNGDYGVVINYNDAIVSTGVIGFTGAGIEIANICFQCSQAIPIMLAGLGGNVADAAWIHDCWFKGDNSKTCTIGISGELKNSLIENNIINGCITGINIAAGKWFNMTVVRKNKITNVTNGINIAATAVCTESEISGNKVIGSSTSIVNGQATDVIIFENAVKPALTDAGAAEGDNTILS